jgi:hypothetical protein
MSKQALITGASGGLGREFARQLAATGIDTVLASRNKEKLEKLKAEIESDYRTAAAVVPIDLSLPGAANALFAECEKRKLRIDILINNAGTGLFGESVTLEPEKIEGMLILNVAALTSLASIFGAKMVRRGGGHILNVGSFAGNQATPYFAGYAASKRYVHDFSLALRRELKRTGVMVTCLVPGFVSTGFDENAGISNPRYLSFSKRRSLPVSEVVRTGLQAMFKGKGRVTAGAGNKLLAVIAAMVPPRIKTAIIHSGVGWIIR